MKRYGFTNGLGSLRPVRSVGNGLSLGEMKCSGWRPGTTCGGDIPIQAGVVGQNADPTCSKWFLYSLIAAVALGLMGNSKGKGR